VVQKHFGYVAQLFALDGLFVRVNLEHSDLVVVVPLNFVAWRVEHGAMFVVQLYGLEILLKLQTELTHLEYVQIVELFGHRGVVPGLNQRLAELNFVHQFLARVLQMRLEVLRVHTLVFVLLVRNDFVMLHIGAFAWFVLECGQSVFIDGFVHVDVL